MYHTAFVPYSSLHVEYMESRTKHDMHVLHYHDTYEIYLQTAGERYIFFHGFRQTLRPGDLYLIQPFQMHYSQSLTSDYYARYVMNVSAKGLQTLLTPTETNLLLAKLVPGLYHLSPEQYEEMERLFRSLHSCHGKEQFLSEKLQYAHVLQILLNVRQYTPHKTSLPLETGTDPVKPEIIHAINYINSHYMEPLTLDMISREVHISKYYLCRLFREATGTTFLEYLNDIRLSKAHQLLLETNLSIGEIAAKTGFSSGLRLSKVFHSSYHMPPSKFRRHPHEQENNSQVQKVGDSHSLSKGLPQTE